MKQHRDAGELRLADIAERAGVSAATVSLVMNDKGVISEKTRRRIKKIVAESGYIYNKRAASMRTRRTYNVGVLLQNLTNPYFGELLSGLSRFLDTTRYLPFLANAEEKPDLQDKLLGEFMETGMDGAILYLARHTAPGTFDRLRKWGKPVMLVFRDFGRQDFDYLGPDNYLGGKLAAAALVRAGHRRIVFAGGADSSTNRAERYRGYADALREAGLGPRRSDNLFLDSYTRRDGIYLGEHILSRCKKATAAMFFNDALALGALSVFLRRGLEPGRDLGVMGFDNIAEAAMSIPALCSVATDPFGMGGRMGEMLLRRIANPDLPPARLREEPRLVIRETSGCDVEAISEMALQ